MNAVEVGLKVNQGIKAVYFERGGTADQWAKITADPREFNRVWRWSLGLRDECIMPPPEWRNIDPSTGELLHIDREDI